MKIAKLLFAGIVSIAATTTAHADGIAQSVGALETDVDSLQAEVSALQTENAALQGVIGSLTSIVDDLVEQQRCHQNATQHVDWSGCTFVWLDLWNEPSTAFVEDNLFGANLSHATFTNSNFVYVIGIGANLEGTTFENVNLAYGDWTGANVVTALEAQEFGQAETVFINTNCPDETFIVDSRVSAESCEGHLSP